MQASDPLTGGPCPRRSAPPPQAGTGCTSRPGTCIRRPKRTWLVQSVPACQGKHHLLGRPVQFLYPAAEGRPPRPAVTVCTRLPRENPPRPGTVCTRLPRRNPPQPAGTARIRPAEGRILPGRPVQSDRACHGGILLGRPRPPVDSNFTQAPHQPGQGHQASREARPPVVR